MSFHALPTDTVSKTISNDAFWPRITVQDFQARYRLPAEYQQAMVEEHLSQALIGVNLALNPWKVDRELEGITSLNGIESQSINDKKAVLWDYERAVYCEAKASLLREYATVTRREVANNAAKDSDETEDHFQAKSNEAIRRILGLGRISVALL